MDAHIADMPATSDDDLMIADGIAYQRDMSAGRVEYGNRYLQKIGEYDKATARAVNSGRCGLLARHAAPAATVLDVGAGDGAFVRCARSWGFAAFGFDVIPEAAHRLRADDMFEDEPALFDAVTMWDVIEHLEDPALILRRVSVGALLCVSLPIFADLRTVRDSKHYRPGEHLVYWQASGFVAWMSLYGFRLLEQSAHEIDAGREDIGAFAFRRPNT